ncbi:MAG: hypothetical protein CMJ46_11635 [Planctomyces sp.]|nr:hypothetical protein [Planctomyces sp.]
MIALAPFRFLNWRKSAGVILIAGICLSGLEGCASLPPVQMTRDGRPRYDQIELTCQFRRDYNYAAILPTHTEEIALVSGTEDSSSSDISLPTPSATPEWNRGKLEIIAPAPDGKPGEALIRLKYWKEDQPLLQAVRTHNVGGESSFRKSIQRVAFKPEANPDWLGQDEPSDPSQFYVREAIVPRHKIDFLLSDLVDAGFLLDQHRPVGDTWMSLKSEQGEVAKRWDFEPRLLELVNESLAGENAIDSEEVRFVPRVEEAARNPIVTISGIEFDSENGPAETSRVIPLDEAARFRSEFEAISHETPAPEPDAEVETESSSEKQSPDENELDFEFRPENIFLN